MFGQIWWHLSARRTSMLAHGLKCGINTLWNIGSNIVLWSMVLHLLFHVYVYPFSWQEWKVLLVAWDNQFSSLMTWPELHSSEKSGSWADVKSHSLSFMSSVKAHFDLLAHSAGFGEKGLWKYTSPYLNIWSRDIISNRKQRAWEVRPPEP